MCPATSCDSCFRSRSSSMSSLPSSGHDEAHRFAKDRNGNLVLRKRRWAPKNRSGCLTCRARHLKCDETKPICSRCCLAGRRCGGYVESASTLALLKPLKLKQPKHQLAPGGVQASSHDYQIFDLFRTVTVVQISGGVDQSFWSDDLLCATHTYPAIWHACLALSAMHEWMKLDASISSHRHNNNNKNYNYSHLVAERAQEYYTFALWQYNASIGHVLNVTRAQELSYAAKETLLMTSMLYAGVCCLQNNPAQAMMHIRNAAEIFGQWRFWEHADNYTMHGNGRREGVLNAQSLVRLVMTFYYQFRDLKSGDDDSVGPLVAVLQGPRSLSRSNEPFGSPTEAYYEFLPILHMDFTCPHCAPLDDEVGEGKQQLPRKSLKTCLGHVFTNWKTRFQGLVETCKNTSPHKSPLLVDDPDSHTMQLLEIFEDTFEAIYFPRTPETWKKLESKFHRAIDSAERLLQQQAACWSPSSSSSSSSSAKKAPIYSYSLSVLEVLTMVGIVSRNRCIRQRVTGLLDGWPRRDGMCSSKLMKLVIQSIEEEEDAALLLEGQSICACVRGEFVCNLHKVGHVDVSFLSDQMVRIGVRSGMEVDVPGRTAIHAL